MRLSIACSTRFGSSPRRLGSIGSIGSVIAAAVADVRIDALRQALQLVRANSSIAVVRVASIV